MGSLVILFIILIAFILFLFGIFVVLPMIQEQVISQAPVISINISAMKEMGQSIIP